LSFIIYGNKYSLKPFYHKPSMIRGPNSIKMNSAKPEVDFIGGGLCRRSLYISHCSLYGFLDSENSGIYIGKGRRL